MPSIMIHEKIGYDLSTKLHIHSYDYYLGLLAPDAPNLNGFAPKEERWMAHQRRQDYDEWKDSLDSFYHKNQTHYSRDFLIGYYIHIMTDIVYDDLLYLNVRERILKHYPMEEAHQIMSDDMYSYYFPEFGEIKTILKESSQSYDILNISKDTLLLWKEKQISRNIEESHCRYLTEQDISFLGEQVFKEVEERIEP